MKRGSKKLHACIALSTFVLIAGIVYGATISSGHTIGSFHAAENGLEQAVFAACVLMTFPLALWMINDGTVRRPLLTIDILLFLVTISGTLGGNIIDDGSISISIAYALILGIRNYVLFILVPRSKIANEVDLVSMVLSWWIASTVIIDIGSLIFAGMHNMLLPSSHRLHGTGQGWLHANHIANYSSCSVLGCCLYKKTNPVVKMSIIAVGLYVLVLTQGRTSLIALPVALLLYFVLKNITKARRIIAFIILFALTGISAGTLIFASIKEQPAYVRLTNGLSNEGDSAASGRLVNTRAALELVSASPVFGLGYRAFAYENGLISLTVEVGFIGILLYCIFVFSIFFRALNIVFKSTDEYLVNVANIIIVITVFIFVRSLGERINLSMISDPITSVWFILSGYMLTSTHKSPRACLTHGESASLNK